MQLWVAMLLCTVVARGEDDQPHDGAFASSTERPEPACVAPVPGGAAHLLDMPADAVMRVYTTPPEGNTCTAAVSSNFVTIDLERASRLYPIWSAMASYAAVSKYYRATAHELATAAIAGVAGFGIESLHCTSTQCVVFYSTPLDGDPHPGVQALLAGASRLGTDVQLWRRLVMRPLAPPPRADTRVVAWTQHMIHHPLDDACNS